MNIAFPLLGAVTAFALAYLFYARTLARVFGLDAGRQTPAVAKRDNVDFVPTKLGVVFSHHFASIAGGGPILGPTLALIFGYNLTFFWIVVGCIFFGAVHDFVALFVSVREGGRSLAEVARRIFGEFGFLLFLGFTVITLIMIIVAFLGATVAALTSKYPLALIGLSPDQTILKTVVENGVVKGKIGGIASTSVFVITAFAPLLGALLYRRRIPVWVAGIIALAVCAGSIEIGLRFPVMLDPAVWRVVLCLYVLVAAGIPVWIILQPRDFTNAFILYLGILGMAAAVILGGLGHLGPEALAAAGAGVFRIDAPGFNFAEGAKKLGAVWPILFITVACGAISGFHALVAGGTSSKQVCDERDIKRIGYGGMLLEGVLAVCVLCVVGAGIDFARYRDIVFPAVPGAAGNPILAFALALGAVLQEALGVPQVYGTIFGILLVEGFVVTTLDTSVRLCRYLLEELWAALFRKVPALLKSYLFNAGLVVAVSYLLAASNSIDKVWPIFGSANQLIAAMVLVVAAAWFRYRGKPVWFLTIPAALLLVTTIASLVYLLVVKYWKAMNIPLIAADLLLIALSAGFVVMIFRQFGEKPSPTAPEGSAR